MTTANKLTILRMCMIPFFVAAFYIPNRIVSSILCAVLFLLAYITDYVDGYIARKYNQITTFGKFMDPIADKLLTTAALIMLTSACGGSIISPIITLIIIGREFVVSGLRLIVASEGTVMAASWLGKAKTMSQFIALQLALLTPFLSDVFGSWYGVFVQVLLWISVALTVWSGVDYVYQQRGSISMK